VNVTVNGEQRALPAGATVADVASTLGVDPGARGIAVALGGEVVPRGRWGETPLADGDVVEVVAAIQGG
jgi:sulfur carrier protein